MRIVVFSTNAYDQRSLEAENAAFGHELEFLETRLDRTTAVLAEGFGAVCVFVNDVVDAATLEALAAHRVRVVALRCAGFNNVDLVAAERIGTRVVRVPAYSPHAVAEFTVALVLSLNRKTHKAYARVREQNFSLEGLLGFDLVGRTVGVVGTGKIGRIFARIMQGFGCGVVAHDPFPHPEVKALGIPYTSLPELYRASDIVSLHCPLTPETHHLIDGEALAQMRRGAMLVNTGRGALIDTQAVIDALKSGQLGYLGLDVYEQEQDLFFRDLSSEVIQDDVIARLLTFPNVLITGHQAFFTREALANIARTTLGNVADLEAGRPCPNLVTAERVAGRAG